MILLYSVGRGSTLRNCSGLMSSRVHAPVSVYIGIAPCKGSSEFKLVCILSTEDYERHVVYTGSFSHPCTGSLCISLLVVLRYTGILRSQHGGIYAKL